MTAKAMKILVVDDDKTMRDSLRFALETEGIAVELASGPSDAVAAITRTRFDAVVTDLAMAGDGRHVLTRMQALRPGTPVIVVTGDPTDSRSDSTLGGAYAILHKPFPTARLVALLRRCKRPNAGDVS